MTDIKRGDRVVVVDYDKEVNGKTGTVTIVPGQQVGTVSSSSYYRVRLDGSSYEWLLTRKEIVPIEPEVEPEPEPEPEDDTYSVLITSTNEDNTVEGVSVDLTEAQHTSLVALAQHYASENER